MSDTDALVRFCAARTELTAIDERTLAQRRKLSGSAATCRDVLRSQLELAHAQCVPVTCEDGRTMYAHVRQSAPRVPLSPELVMSAIGELRYDASETSRMPRTLSGCVEQLVRAKLDEASRAAHPGRRPTIAVTARKPKDVPETALASVHPEQRSRIQETADAFVRTQTASKALRAEPRRKELQSICRDTEPVVAAHLSQHDPSHGTRRVRLVDAGRESTFYLQRRQPPARPARASFRTVMPPLRRRIAELAREQGLDDAFTHAAVHWLTSPGTIARLEREVRRHFDDAKPVAGKERVRLASIG